MTQRVLVPEVPRSGQYQKVQQMRFLYDPFLKGFQEYTQTHLIKSHTKETLNCQYSLSRLADDKAATVLHILV